ncbi:hypothetical protein J6590_096069, partial [Homalodisca vitripennis]
DGHHHLDLKFQGKGNIGKEHKGCENSYFGEISTWECITTGINTTLWNPLQLK